MRGYKLAVTSGMKHMASFALSMFGMARSDGGIAFEVNQSSSRDQPFLKYV